MFIQTEATPNPATLKFLPGRSVLETGTLDMPRQGGRRAVAARRSGCSTSPMSAACSSARTSSPSPRTAASGSSSSRRSSAPSWSISCPARRCLTRDAQPADARDDEFFDAEDAETVATIKDLIETRVRPAVAGDGGDITFTGYKEGVVYLHMKGACSGCPSSTATLQARHPEPAAPFRAGRDRSAAGVIANFRV